MSTIDRTTTPPAATPIVGTVTNVADLVAESAWRVKHVRTLSEAEEAAEIALKVSLSPEQLALFKTYEEAARSNTIETSELYCHEIGRHLPGLAPAIWAIQHHIYESRLGECCLPDVEPPAGLLS